MRRPLAISLVAHGAAFIALMYAPTIKLPEPSPSEYKQAIAGKEARLVWYKLKEIPEVASKPAKTPAKAETIAKQAMVAAPKQAKKQPQIVWTPAPEIPQLALEPLPNILAVKLAPPPPKPFVAPPDIHRPVPQIEPLPDAPQLTGKVVKPFLPPPDFRKPPTRIEPLPDAPQVAGKDVKHFLPPLTQPPPPAPPLIASDEAPPDLNIAVVGLNPADKFIPLPIAPNPAQFSAAPQLRKEGSDSTGGTRGLAVPDVSIRGKLLAEAYAAPTSPYAMREALRRTQPNLPAVAPDPLPASKPARPAAPKVSSAPDSRFNNRDVYMMAIQMPNLTSYSGSWLMWYSDHTAKQTGLAAIAPPEAHRKVDPKYVASAISDRVQGKIQLFCVIGKDGLVSSIEIVKGLDDRLNTSAMEALGKWQFTPASREGEPVAVDVLVEIPFRLQPLLP